MRKLIIVLIFGVLIVNAFAQKAPLAAKVSVSPNNSTNLCFIADQSSNTFVQVRSNSAKFTFDFKKPVISSYYTIVSASVERKNDPQQWVLKASLDGKKWDVLDIKSDIQFYSRFQEAAFEIAFPAPYRYYQITLKSEKKSKLAVAEISFFDGSYPLANWSDFVFPEVNFMDKDVSARGSNIYNRLINDPTAFIRDHAQKVASILYWSNNDQRKDIRTINYELRPDKGISAKSGDAPIINIFYSADWVDKTANNKGDFDVLYETRGVLYHELTHGYQLEPKGCGKYQRGDEFFAFIEGLADAVRYEAGFFPASNRRLGGHWLDGYQTTGFFLQWLTGKDIDFIKKFNKSAIEINPWSFDAAMIHILGEGNTTQKLWDEYQEYVNKYIQDQHI
jgi:hypothetical protein